jgi:hypothetical protein
MNIHSNWKANFLVFGFLMLHANVVFGQSNGDSSRKSYQIGPWRWVITDVGNLIESHLYYRQSHSVTLPAELALSDSWTPVPYELRYGYIFVWEDSATAEGYTVPVRLEWLRVNGRSAKLTKRVDALICLDEGDPVSVFDRRLVRLSAKEEPATFAVTGADMAFRRSLTWDCTGSGIKLARSDAMDLEARFIDKEIAIARTARRRNALQRKIVKLWPAGRELTEWSETRLKRGLVRVSFDNGVGFVLSGKPGRYRLIDVDEDHSFRVRSLANYRIDE